jgi:hypothetical protein
MGDSAGRNQGEGERARKKNITREKIVSTASGTAPSARATVASLPDELQGSGEPSKPRGVSYSPGSCGRNDTAGRSKPSQCRHLCCSRVVEEAMSVFLAQGT